MSTPVVFRKFKSDGQVIAYFPSTYKDCAPYVMSYMHLGQHGEASPYADNQTVLATEADYLPLLQELKNIAGYDDLVIRKRIVRQYA